MSQGRGAMHNDFPRWVKSLELGDDPIARQRRWNGASELVDEADDDLVETMVRLALKSKQEPTRAQGERVQTVLRGADEGFPEQGNAKEVQILAAAALALLMERRTAYGTTAALSIVTATFDGTLKPNLPVDLIALARKAIAVIGEQERKRPNMDDWEYSGETEIDIEEELSSLAEDEQNGSLVLKTFKAMRDAISSVLMSHIEHQKEFVSSLKPFISAQDEELEMLWWLTGERSQHLNCSFNSVAAAFRPVAFARELADMTTLFPGPISIISLLTRAGIGAGKKQMLAAFVNAVSDEWAKECTDEYDPSPVTAPIHFALKRRKESGAGDDWILGWASVVGADVGISLTPISLGTLFYNECLLRRFAE